MSSILQGLNASGPIVGLSLNPLNLTTFDPGTPPVNVVADAVGIYQVNAKQAGITQVDAAAVGIQQVDADQAGVNQVQADAAGVHQTSAKQVDS